jgi:hypothetical protein
MREMGRLRTRERMAIMDSEESAMLGSTYAALVVVIWAMVDSVQATVSTKSYMHVKWTFCCWILGEDFL